MRSSRTRARLNFSRRESERERARKSAPAASTSQFIRGRGRRSAPTEIAALSARLLRAETLLDAVEQLASVGIWELDQTRQDFYYSPTLAKILGLPLPSGPLPLSSLAEQLDPGNPESVQARIGEVFSTCASSIQSAEQTETFGGRRNHRTLFLALPSDDSSRPRVLGVTQDISAVRAAEDEVRRLSHRLISAQAEEQRRLSRNLHETVAQTLAAINLTLGKISRALPEHPREAARGVQSARSLVEEAIREVRSVAALSHPPLLENCDLGAALRGYSRAYSERSGLHISFKCPPRMIRMPREIEVSILRIIQEALTNIHRHAKARNAGIRIIQSQHLISCDICDDGIGLLKCNGSGAPYVPYGVGIAGMRERIQQLNGSFRIGPVRDGGTIVSVSLPFEAQPKKPASRS